MTPAELRLVEEGCADTDWVVTVTIPFTLRVRAQDKQAAEFKALEELVARIDKVGIGVGFPDTSAKEVAPEV